MVQDHVHMMIQMPPKVLSGRDSRVYKRKESNCGGSSQFGGRRKNFNGEKLWARGYAVSTVGFEREKVQEYVKNQEQLDS